VNVPAPHDIMMESFRIIEDEIGPHKFSEQEWPIVRRMIHACGELDIAPLVRFAKEPVEHGLAALYRGCPLVTDISMVAAGISKKHLRARNLQLHCFIDDPEVHRLAQDQGGTRSYWGMAKALADVGPGIYVVGSSPTALWAIAESIREGRVRPDLVVAVPVGFVAVEESKEDILSLDVPAIVLRGRKGGSGIAAAAVNALLELAFGVESSSHAPRENS